MPKAVLVIDDNLVNQRMVIRYLTAKGFVAHGAASTVEADALLAAHNPGLVLVDVSLPGEDGLTWVRRIRGKSKAAMVAFTAHTLPADRERALSAGCEDMVVKPVDWKLLLGLVNRFCGAPLNA